MSEKTVTLALDIGEKMLQSGGEVYRVEDTIERILKAYRFQKMDVFTITSQIQVNAVDEYGNNHHQFRRIKSWKTDLKRLERLNQISRDICNTTPSEDVIEKLLLIEEKEEKKPEKSKDLVIAYMCGIFASAGFTLFFGGNTADIIATAGLAVLITVMNRHIRFKSENQLLYYLLFSVVTGFAANLVVQIGAYAGVVMSLDKILIGCVMLTIPGVAITYAVRDMLLGETITGMMRFTESVLIAAGIAGGYILASLIMGGSTISSNTTGSVPAAVQIAAAAIGSIGFAGVLNTNRRYWLLVAVDGALSWALFLFCSRFMDSFFVNIIAAAFSSWFAHVVAKEVKAPTTSILMPGSIAMIPGGSLYYTMYYILQGEQPLFQTYLLATCKAIFGMAIGFAVISLFARQHPRAAYLRYGRR